MRGNPRIHSGVILAATAVLAVAWWGLAVGLRAALLATRPTGAGRWFAAVTRGLGLTAERWPTIAWVVGAGLVLTGTALAVLARPGVEAWLTARWPAPPLDPVAARIGPGRRWTVLALVVAIVAGHAACLLLLRTLWPWSYYSLYSRLYPDHLTALRVLGVTPDGRTVPLGEAELAPFSLGRLRTALEGKVEDGHDLTRPLGSLLGLYETNRGLGRHRGPALRAVRLCEETWDLRPTVVDREHPARSRVVAEVAWPDAGRPVAGEPRR